MMLDFCEGLNQFQLTEVHSIANSLPPFSDDVSIYDLTRHTLVRALIDSDGTPEIAKSTRQANIIQGRFRLLMEIDCRRTVTDDHFARLEYLAKEVWREVGKPENEISEMFSGDCNHE